MLFNSFTFALFLPLVFVLHWFVFHKTYKSQNIILLLVSYVFYGWWDWHFLLLLMFSTLLDYYAGLKIQQACNDATCKMQTSVNQRDILYVFLHVTHFGRNACLQSQAQRPSYAIPHRA